MSTSAAPIDTTTKPADRLGAKGALRNPLYDPHVLFIVGLDGGTLGLDAEEEQRIAKLPEWERAAALAPFRIAWLEEQFAADAHALGLIDALVDDRATQPLDASFHASCVSGVHEPVIAVHIGSLRDGSPCVGVCEGRQRVRSLRIHNTDRAAAESPLPPYALATVMKTFASPRKAREIKIVTSNHVALTPLQRALRARELLADNIAPADVAPLVGCTSVKALKDLMEILKKDASVQAAVGAGTVSSAAAREMKHLSAGEQRERVATIASTGAKGKRAREIARTGKAGAVGSTQAPAGSLVEGLAKSLGGSSDPLLSVVGVALVWVTTGSEEGIERIPGLKELIAEEVIRHNGLPLDAIERDRLALRVAALGGIDSAAIKMGVNKGTLARAMTGQRVRTRVRAALLAAIVPEAQPQAA